MKFYIKIIIMTFIFFTSAMFGEEKITYSGAGSETSSLEEKIKEVNIKLKQLRTSLAQKYLQVSSLYENKSEEEVFFQLKEEIKEIKNAIFITEEELRQEHVAASTSSVDDNYAYWDQGEITLSQLIMEYGSTDYLYIIPAELGALKMNMFSTIPIPQSSWAELIEMILNNNGIGIKKLSPYLRTLYVFKQDLSHVETITSNLEHIKHLPDHSTVFFVFTPKLEQTKAVQSFFERYSDPKQANVQIIGNKIVIIASKQSIQKLMQLYQVIWGKENDKVVKVVNLIKIGALEAEKVIKTFFGEQEIKTRPSFFQSKMDEVIVLPLPNNTSLVLVGDLQTVQRTEQLIQDLENQLEEKGESTIFWYNCKHSDPQDIADILSKMYGAISHSSIEGKKDLKSTEVKQEVTCQTNTCERIDVYRPKNPVSPGFINPGRIEADKKTLFTENFVVDTKTNSILMAIRKEDLNKIKNLLKKLDVPKRMAQIEVLLVERKLQDRKQSGLNILKIGTSVSKKQNSMSFDTNTIAQRKGILDFIFMKPKGEIPSFDITMSFLMAQDDLKINAHPSVLAINQTPAMISIVEEISMNNGAVQVSCPVGNNIEKSYTRAQFGIIITMTPTIHLPDLEETEEKGYVTLQTNVTFDTTQSSDDERPPVTRRHIENEVRIADGETIILGGLRRKSQEDSREKIPFLGDLPGIGKLFGTTKLTDNSTEMFIFITPKIIKDPIEDLRLERQKLLKQRPGDIPEFLQRIEEAKEKERKKIFESSLKVLFD